MDVTQIVRIAVMGAEAYGNYKRAKGDDKFDKAIRIIREIEPALVDTQDRVLAIGERIEECVEVFNNNGWEELAELAEKVQALAERAKAVVRRVRSRFEWLTDLVDDVEDDNLGLDVFIDTNK